MNRNLNICFPKAVETDNPVKELSDPPHPQMGCDSQAENHGSRQRQKIQCLKQDEESKAPRFLTGVDYEEQDKMWVWQTQEH